MEGASYAPQGLCRKYMNIYEVGERLVFLSNLVHFSCISFCISWLNPVSERDFLGKGGAQKIGGHGTKFGDFPTVCGHFLASKAGKDAIVAWPKKTFFFFFSFDAKCVGLVKFMSNSRIWWMVIHPPANYLYKMVIPVPRNKPLFYRAFLLISWILEPVPYHFTFLDLGVGIL